MPTNLVHIKHTTEYHYKNPALFQKHTLMLRPFECCKQVIQKSKITSNINMHLKKEVDQFKNIVETAYFPKSSDLLKITSDFSVLHHYDNIEEIEDKIFKNESQNLIRMDKIGILQSVRPHSEFDSDFAEWKKPFLFQKYNDFSTFNFLKQINQNIHENFKYQVREAFGTQSPGETIRKKCGTCRDFAWLLVESARHFGIPSRFVSGYLYNDEMGPEPIGGRSTHAWAECYIDCVGWIPLDPTNNTIGGRNLIKSATVLMPHQAIPVNGSYWSFPGDFLGMYVDVEVASLPQNIPNPHLKN